MAAAGERVAQLRTNVLRAAYGGVGVDNHRLARRCSMSAERSAREFHCRVCSSVRGTRRPEELGGMANGVAERYSIVESADVV